MIIDEKSFLDLTVHLRHASDDLVTAAQRLSRLCDPSCSVGDDRSELVSTLDSLVSMNREFTQRRAPDPRRLERQPPRRPDSLINSRAGRG